MIVLVVLAGLGVYLLTRPEEEDTKKESEEKKKEEPSQATAPQTGLVQGGAMAVSEVRRLQNEAAGLGQLAQPIRGGFVSIGGAIQTPGTNNLISNTGLSKGNGGGFVNQPGGTPVAFGAPGIGQIRDLSGLRAWAKAIALAISQVYAKGLRTLNLSNELKPGTIIINAADRENLLNAMASRLVKIGGLGTTTDQWTGNNPGIFTYGDNGWIVPSFSKQEARSALDQLCPPLAGSSDIFDARPLAVELAFPFAMDQITQVKKANAKGFFGVLIDSISGILGTAATSITGGLIQGKDAGETAKKAGEQALDSLLGGLKKNIGDILDDMINAWPKSQALFSHVNEIHDSLKASIGAKGILDLLPSLTPSDACGDAKVNPPYIGWFFPASHCKAIIKNIQGNYPGPLLYIYSPDSTIYSPTIWAGDEIAGIFWERHPRFPQS